MNSTNSTPTRLHDAMASLPLVAILRGITPEEAEPVGAALVEAGFAVIEVPLNSPRPFDSIAHLRRTVPANVMVGAGTVLRADDVQRVKDAGGEIIVMPHADTQVIRAAKAVGMCCVPGVATPTEAFAAVAAGADAVKLFPAELISPAVLKAMRAVLPADLKLLPVGGITPDNMGPYVHAGASGFGLGSALYGPGRHAVEVGENARRFARAWAKLAAS